MRSVLSWSGWWWQWWDVSAHSLAHSLHALLSLDSDCHSVYAFCSRRAVDSWMFVLACEWWWLCSFVGVFSVVAVVAVRVVVYLFSFVDFVLNA